MNDTQWTEEAYPKALENEDWLQSFEDVLERRGPERAAELLNVLRLRAGRRAGLPAGYGTPYLNTIDAAEQPEYPGDRAKERTLKSLIRWNAMAMVVRANREQEGIGGHISTYASCATLFEVAFNHFLRGPDDPCGGDLVYFQGHASPGVYARAYLERRLDAKDLENFRTEVDAPGLSSYPHPWLMPEFWQFPSVSMGLSPIMAIYQARFLRYLEDRGLASGPQPRVWAFIGDGECDEPESLGALSVASREQLGNLIFVVNCNLQRLDGPVRGNGKVIQELERVFAGAGWNVIKVVWASNWDSLIDGDDDGRLLRRMEAAVDGDYLRYRVEGGSVIRNHFFGADPQLARRVEHMSDEDLWRLGNGGHDPVKVYAAYHRAVRAEKRPTVILAKTIKGYGLGEAGEGRNVSHQQKKLNESELMRFRDRFDVPIADEEVQSAPFHRLDEDSPEIEYLLARRRALGGFLPERRVSSADKPALDETVFDEFMQGTERSVATTMVLVRMLSKLMGSEGIGERIVPIVPDEARTFGLDALFRKFGIYAHAGQRYRPVDAKNVMYYREASDGQILEEGITEAGCMSSFTAAGSAYASVGLPMLPVFMFYSMFGFQRVGDLIWASADARARGFLIGCTSGRTTLNGEGLQHQDGHSHVIAQTVPNVRAFDPAFAYELAVLVRWGIQRMYYDDEDEIVYLTVANELYPQPSRPDGVEDGIVKGLYRLREGEPVNGGDGPGVRVHLLGSGPALNEVLRARAILHEDWGIAADVWSATSFTELRRDALRVDRSRWRAAHREEPESPKSHLEACFGHAPAVFVAATDFMKALPDGIAKWLPGPLVSLGTDGFGRSDTRRRLRRFFEVDAEHVAFHALSVLHRQRAVDAETVRRAAEALKIDVDGASAGGARDGERADHE